MGKETSQNGLMKPFFIALMIMLALLAIWHWLLPALGVVLVLSASVWSVLVAAVILCSVSILLFFILTGIGLLLLAGFATIGLVFAVIFEPVLFPILIPLLIMALFIAYVRRQKNKDC